MIISRRPNKRRSTEKAPGPNRAIAAATITTRNAGSGVLKRFEVAGGTHDRAMPIVASATSTPPTGVRNPTKSDTPLAMTIKPASHASDDPLPGSVRYTAPWTIAVTPIPTRSRSKPKPGRPPGNVENNRCRPGLLCASARSPSAKLSVMVSVEKRIPIAWNFSVTLSGYSLPDLLAGLGLAFRESPANSPAGVSTLRYGVATPLSRSR
jgi:hypothetical protein